MAGVNDIKKYVINLPHRKDRVQIYEAFLRTAGWEAEVVPGELTTPGRIGCANAHLECVRRACSLGLHEVMIIEDDARWTCDEAHWHFEDAFSELPEDWQLYSAGVHSCGSIGVYSKKLQYLGSDFSWSHCYVVRGRAMERILGWDGKSHIDRWMNRDNAIGQCYVNWPITAVQTSSYSDNTRRMSEQMTQLRLYDKKYAMRSYVKVAPL